MFSPQVYCLLFLPGDVTKSHIVVGIERFLAIDDIAVQMLAVFDDEDVLLTKGSIDGSSCSSRPA